MSVVWYGIRGMCVVCVVRGGVGVLVNEWGMVMKECIVWCA